MNVAVKKYGKYESYKWTQTLRQPPGGGLQYKSSLEGAFCYFVT